MVQSRDSRVSVGDEDLQTASGKRLQTPAAFFFTFTTPEEL
jgi:hypothetical protein